MPFFFFFFDSYKNYQSIFNSSTFDLPIRWDGKDFVKTLETLFKKYKAKLKTYEKLPASLYKDVENVTDLIIRILNVYQQGHPNRAFNLFSEELYQILMDNELTLLNETSCTKLYRTRMVELNKSYEKKDIFHVPFNQRNNISPTRYSIAGFPCLYLGSSIELCLEEMDYKIKNGRYIASRFELAPEKSVRIFDLGVKPSDFREKPKMTTRRSLINLEYIKDDKYFKRYLVWYPFIAACSFVRINKKDPFSIEYVLPQIFMEKINELVKTNVIVGVRYFSCSSSLASNKGFNYVFPTTGIGANDNELYCKELAEYFYLTKPKFLNDYSSVKNCEVTLNKLKASNIFK